MRDLMSIDFKNIVGEGAEPTLYLREGDNEIAIFEPEIGQFQLVAVSQGIDVLYDQSFSTMMNALKSLNRFLINEYAPF